LGIGSMDAVSVSVNAAATAAAACSASSRHAWNQRGGQERNGLELACAVGGISCYRSTAFSTKLGGRQGVLLVVHGAKVRELNLKEVYEVGCLLLHTFYGEANID